MSSDVLIIELNSEHKQCIIKLINDIISKSPQVEQLNYDSLLLTRLVSVISLIETTLCSQYHIVLKRNTTAEEYINAIKSWLKQYYRHEFIDSLCQSLDEISGHPIDSKLSNNDIDISLNDNNDVIDNNGFTSDQISNSCEDRDISLMSLLILSIAHKLRQSLPRINAYFDPEWSPLSQFDHVLHQMTNCDKLLELVQNELCIKRKELEVTRSQVSRLKSTLKTKILSFNKEKESALDYRSNLFAEYEDETDQQFANVSGLASDDQMSEISVQSEIFSEDPSDDDYVPGSKGTEKIVTGNKSKKRKIQVSKTMKKGIRGRPRPKSALKPIRITNKSISKSQTKSTDISIDESMDTNEPYECDVCGKKFAKEYRLTRHSFTHTGHKQFQCTFPDCMESFDLKWKLSDHQKEHGIDRSLDDEESYAMSSSNHQFQCEWADCRESFQSKRELTVHEHEMHANRSTSKYSCDWPQCKEIFENKIDWRKHVKTHGKISPTECGFPGCHKSFYKLDSLENHRKIHETFSLSELS